MSRRRPAAIRETDHGSGFSDRVTETGHRRRAAGKGSFGGRAREAKIEGPQLRGDLRKNTFYLRICCLRRGRRPPILGYP